ncbi:MAG: hypothetical protein R3F60_06215 [bacterium]
MGELSAFFQAFRELAPEGGPAAIPADATGAAGRRCPRSRRCGHGAGDAGLAEPGLGGGDADVAGADGGAVHAVVVGADGLPGGQADGGVGQAAGVVGGLEDDADEAAGGWAAGAQADAGPARVAAGARWTARASLASVNLRLLELAGRWDEFWAHDGIERVLDQAFKVETA